jgi:hypothetical protein
MLLLAVSRDGERLWDSLYTERVCSDLLLESGDEVIAVGHQNSRAVAKRLDGLTGEEVWRRTYGTAASAFTSVIKPTGGGGGYLYGGVHDDPGSGPDAWLWRTDDAGNRTWSATFDLSATGADTLYDLIETSDGGFAFCGVAGGDRFLLKTSPIGAEQWRVVTAGDRHASSVSLVEEAAGILAVLSMRRNVDDSYAPLLSRVNLDDGSSVLIEELPGRADGWRGELIRDEGGGVAAVYTAFSDYEGGDGTNRAMRLVRTDAALLWTVDYEAFNPTHGHGLLQLAEGNYVAVGSQRETLATEAQPYIVKTTYNGRQHPE